MSALITFKLKDGSTKEFRHHGRAGGSYTIRLTFEAAFAVVTDEWGNRTCIPAADIVEINDDPGRRY